MFLSTVATNLANTLGWGYGTNCFTMKQQNGGTCSVGEHGSGDLIIYFNASNSNNIYIDDGKNRPDSLSFNQIIKY